MKAIRAIYEDLKFGNMNCSIDQLRNKCCFLEEKYKTVRNKIDSTGWGIGINNHDKTLEKSGRTIKGMKFKKFINF